LSLKQIAINNLRAINWVILHISTLWRKYMTYYALDSHTHTKAPFY